MKRRVTPSLKLARGRGSQFKRLVQGACTVSREKRLCVCVVAWVGWGWGGGVCLIRFGLAQVVGRHKCVVRVTGFVCGLMWLEHANSRCTQASHYTGVPRHRDRWPLTWPQGWSVWTQTASWLDLSTSITSSLLLHQWAKQIMERRALGGMQVVGEAGDEAVDLAGGSARCVPKRRLARH